LKAGSPGQIPTGFTPPSFPLCVLGQGACPKSSGSALTNPPLGLGGFQGEEEVWGSPLGLLPAEVPATEGDFITSSLSFLLCSAAWVGNDDGVKFKSPENGLLFLSVLIEVKAFYFLV
jgi:hypothetical protein